MKTAAILIIALFVGIFMVSVAGSVFGAGPLAEFAIGGVWLILVACAIMGETNKKSATK